MIHPSDIVHRSAGTAPRLLSGEWSGFRDCHVKPDLVLIYEKPGTDTLRLVRLGSHSELGW